MKLLSISFLATSASLLAIPAQALYIPAQYDILPDLIHAAKQPSQKSHQVHYDIVEILPEDHQEQRKHHYSYKVEEDDDHNWLNIDIEGILESVFGKSKDTEKELHAQRVKHSKEPTSHRKDHHKSHDKELDDLAEILEADGVNIGVMIVS